MILFDNRTNEEIKNEVKKLIHMAVHAALEYEGFEEEAEVSVSFVTNEEIKELNKEYRDKDSITDVLSFPMSEPGEYMCINPETNEVMLGDVVISLDRAREQALEFGHAFEREVAFLTVHSILHLLGYDHMEENEEKVMREKQREILLKVGLDR